MGGISMSENKNCTPTKIKEAVCIDTNRVYDSCADKDCLEDLKVYFTNSAQSKLKECHLTEDTILLILLIISKSVSTFSWDTQIHLVWWKALHLSQRNVFSMAQRVM